MFYTILALCQVRLFCNTSRRMGRALASHQDTDIARVGRQSAFHPTCLL